MTQHWVQGLSTATPTRGVSSIATRQRAIATIGASATDWGIEVGGRMARSILDRLVEWSGDRSDAEKEALQRATEASTLDTLCALVTGDTDKLARSREPRENVTYYVMNEIPLEEVVHNVHLGQDYMVQELLDVIADHTPEAQRMDAVRDMNRIVSLAWARLISSVSAEYAREYDRWARSAEGNRAQTIRRLIAGEESGEALASDRIGYDLAQQHVSVIVWLDTSDADIARLFNYEVFANELAAACGSRSAPLVHFTASTYAELWIGSPQRAVCEAFAGGMWPPQLRIAHGRPDSGLAGFRETLLEARATHQLARRAASLGTCIDYDSVELVSLLVSDVDRATKFVRRTLGPLAETDDRAAELRQTLATWIDTQGSVSAASKALFMHRNSVAYRVRQAHELLGATGSGDIDRVRVRCALAIVEILPDEVLVPSTRATETKPAASSPAKDEHPDPAH